MKTLQLLEAPTKNGLEKKIFVKCQKILKEYKSERSFENTVIQSFENTSRRKLLVTLQAFNLQLCQKNKSQYKYFSIKLPVFYLLTTASRKTPEKRVKSLKRNV